MLTFYCHRDETVSNPRSEISLSQIRGLLGDLSQMEGGRYNLKVLIEGDELNFKFKNKKDFYHIVDCIRRSLANLKDYTLKDSGFVLDMISIR